MKIKYQVTVFLVLSSLFVSITLFASTTLANQLDIEEPDTEPDVVRQDESAAQAADIAILASETGIPIETVEQAIVFQQAFAEYADELITRFPDQISAVWVEPIPNTRGHIQFTGEVPTGLASEIGLQSLLNANNIFLTGGGMISMADHFRRAELATEALIDLGYQNAITFFDPIDKVIRIELQIPEGASQPNELDLVGAVQNRVRADQDIQGRAAMVDALDLELTVITGSGPIITLEHSRGGNWLRDDGVRECTSGWSVSGPDGNGIITAGHCSGLNEFEQPGVTPYSMSWKDQEYGADGDVEYHTTDHSEYAEFYADSTNVRDVNGIKTTSTMVGNSVCVYGRSSNNRTCNHTVEAVDVTVLANGSVEVGNLARASNATTTGGDSGGGWSWGTTAWGVHHGQAGGKGYFTPVEEAQNALNVTILTK